MMVTCFAIMIGLLGLLRVYYVTQNNRKIAKLAGGPEHHAEQASRSVFVPLTPYHSLFLTFHPAELTSGLDDTRLGFLDMTDRENPYFFYQL
jgi:hypothetical protein